MEFTANSDINGEFSVHITMSSIKDKGWAPEEECGTPGGLYVMVANFHILIYKDGDLHSDATDYLTITSSDGVEFVANTKYDGSKWDEPNGISSISMSLIINDSGENTITDFDYQ
jgi:hypothetical protein